MDDFDCVGQHEGHMSRIVSGHAGFLQLGVVVHMVHVEPVSPEFSDGQDAGVAQLAVVVRQPVSDVLPRRGAWCIQAERVIFNPSASRPTTPATSEPSSQLATDGRGSGKRNEEQSLQQHLWHASHSGGRRAPQRSGSFGTSTLVCQGRQEVTLLWSRPQPAVGATDHRRSQTGEAGQTDGGGAQTKGPFCPGLHR